MASTMSVSVWAFVFSLCFGVSKCYFAIPLRIYTGSYNVSSAVDVSRRVVLTSDGNGLSLASDPTGTVNFLDMVNNLQGDSGRGYYIEMSLGTPGQKVNILVDTGSSNFAVAAAPHPFITHYFNTALSSTYRTAGRTVAVRYTQGNWEGELGIDSVSIPKGPNGTIAINIAAILLSEGFFLPGVNWQGILGLAYPMLLFLSLCPSFVCFLFVFLLIQIQDFSSGFWDGSKLACWMKGETPWRFFPKLSIYLRATNTSQSFRITILPQVLFSVLLTVISQLYIQPITDIDGTMDCFRFGLSASSNGLVIGATVMEGFYVVFDRAQRRLGFALSNCAVSSGVALSEIAGPFSATDVAANCSGGAMKEPLLWVISYALIAVCAVVLIILLLLLVLPCRRRNFSGEITDESSLVRHRIK